MIETMISWTDWHLMYNTFIFWLCVSSIIAIVYALYRFIHRNDDAESDDDEYDDEDDIDEDDDQE